MKKRTFIILIITLVIGIGTLVVYKILDEKTPDVSDRKADMTTDVKTLIAAFDKDTASSKKMYVDKLIELKGTVVSIDTSGSIVLGEAGDASSVTVSLDRRHISDYKKLQVGNVAIVKGICTGFSKASGDDLLASLGTTVELNFASVKNKK